MAGGDASLLLEQLSKAFLDLQALRDVSSGEKVQWKEIVEHFRKVDASFKENFLEIEAKKKEFELKEAEARSLIAERKVAVAAKEQAMLDRVQELKDVAVAAVSAFVSNSASQHRLNPEPVNDGEDRKKCDKEAMEIAREWILMLKGAKETADESNSVGAAALLQLLATFRVASEFSQEGLCKLVLAVAHNRQTPELCRSLGLMEKMPVIIEQLLRSGRQVDAVHCIHAFKLTESFPPVPLLKRFLKDLRKSFWKEVAASDVASTSQIDVNARELAALRTVIGCVEEYNLESQYKIDRLQKRLEQLENARPHKKRAMAGGGGDLNRRSHNRPSKILRSKAGGEPATPVIAQRAPLRHPNSVPTFT